ncbi:hypothetical protein K439DRAFT_1610370 [Ramaria rubella]|nr:hypothetical protein K439DRAFT_1610370 [Ramaria rubella]
MASRYMNATASSRAAAALTGPRTAVTSQHKTLVVSPGLPKYNVTRPPTHADKNTPVVGPIAKQRPTVPTVDLTKSTKPPAPSAVTVNTTTHELEIASQLYPWIFMRHTLLESSNNAVAESEASGKLEAEEGVLEDYRQQHQLEMQLRLLDDLLPECICCVFAPLIQTFVDSAEKCQNAITDVKQMTRNNLNALHLLRSSLQNLDNLVGESTLLHKSFAGLLSNISPESPLASTLERLLALLDVRLKNLALSRRVLEAIRNNERNMQHLQSLEMEDDLPPRKRKMSALLDEPTLLISYPTPSKNIPTSSGESKTNSRHNVSVTCYPSDFGEGFVTVSVQGDGIYVLELSSAHAILSHTLGPNAVLAAAAVTRFDNSHTITSYAVMESGPDGIEKAERGRTVWRWRDHYSRRPEEIPEPKQSVVVSPFQFPQRVEKLWVSPNLPDHLIAISPSGDVILSDDALNVVSSIFVSDRQSRLLKSWVFIPEECSFIRAREDQLRSVVVLCFIVVAGRVKLRIVIAQANGELAEVTECDLGIFQPVIDISCNSSGYITVLTQRGEWQFLRLSYDTSNSITATSLNNLRLAGLSLANNGTPMCGLSTMSVGSSFVVLVGISSGSTPEIIFLLWDIQYCVVLTSQTFTLPTTLMHDPKMLPTFELVPASRTQALLVLSPAKRIPNPERSRSTILLLPLTIPFASTISIAMGKAHDTQKWLQNKHAPPYDEDDKRRQMALSIRQALEQGRPRDAENTFFAWITMETVRVECSLKKNSANDRNREGNGGGAKAVSKTGMDMKAKQKPKPPLSHHFVSTILNIVLQPSYRTETTYSSKIVQYLIDRQAVSHAMVDGGLLPALRLRRDWNSIASAISYTQDLPESDLIQLLAEVARSHRQYKDNNEVQVDDIPPLPNFLAMLVSHTMSLSMLPTALRLHLPDAKDIVCILEVLEGWLGFWCDTNTDLPMRSDRFSTSTTQRPDIGTKWKTSKQNELPSMGSVMSFLQSMLDAHFLALLQYPPSHIIIESISRHLCEELTSIEDLDRLRGPLEAFTRAQFQKSRLRRVEQEGGGDWRKRRKEASQAAELAIGLYQIEELVI